MTQTSQSARMWEGRVIDALFPLQQLLGETDHSAVFSTEYTDGATKKKAAIKLVAADGPNADLQLANWNFASHMPHPNLLQLYRWGRCSVNDNDLLYVVMEHADEDLADILPERPLTPNEAREMLPPVLDALEFLHGKGLVHRNLKPANILAAGDQLKLSSDSITRTGEGLAVPKKPGVYDPPEAVSGVVSPAGDVWGLGTTLVEVLTKKLPEWQAGSNREPFVPPTLGAPFFDIARQCLRLEPDRRMHIADIAARLNPRAAAASAAASRTAVNVAQTLPPPLLTPAQPPMRVGSASVAASAPGKPVFADPPVRRQASLPSIPLEAAQAAQRARTGPSYMTALLVVAALVFAVVLVVPRLLTHKPELAAPAPSASAPTSPAPDAGNSTPGGVTTPVKPKQDAATHEPAHAASSAAKSPADLTSKPSPDATAANSVKSAAAGATAPTPVAESSPAPGAAPVKPAVKSHAGQGQVLDQILPEVPQKARDTIQGRVHVGVKVHVDAAGAVTAAELDSPGPSKYFADWALEASKKWAFTPPEVEGKSVPSEWILSFIFTQTDTKVTPTQTAP